MSTLIKLKPQLAGESLRQVHYDFGMSAETQELMNICEQLPQTRRAEVADFARFLLAQEGDQHWEKIIAETKPRQKLKDFLSQSAKETAIPMNPDEL